MIIMQKIINVLAVVSFAVSAGVVGGGAYLYTQREAITEDIKEKVAAGVAEALPGMIQGAMGGAALPGVPSGGGDVGSPAGGISVPSGLPF